MKTSPSSRALGELLAAATKGDPTATRRRLALYGRGIDRVSLWEYAKGHVSPSSARAGEIEQATDGAVLANGWIPDGE